MQASCIMGTRRMYEPGTQETSEAKFLPDSWSLQTVLLAKNLRMRDNPDIFIAGLGAELLRYF